MKTELLAPDDRKLLEDLHRCHLRHPGLVKATVRNLIQRTEITPLNLESAKAEWRRLGLNNLKARP